MIIRLIELISDLVWSTPTIIFIILVGLYFTISLGFIQARTPYKALKTLRSSSDSKNSISAFKALSAAVSGNVGLGNLAGVAIAIATGGPGAIFWMWIVAFLGMALRFAECSIGNKHKKQKPSGEYYGGPMWYISKKFGKHGIALSKLYALSLLIFTFGAGSLFQTNQAAQATKDLFHTPPMIFGLVMAILITSIVYGGIKRIGQVTQFLTPIMCGGYLICVFTIILSNISLLPNVVYTIIQDAFSGYAVAGGSMGFVIQTGMRRALFSTTAGTGDVAIMYATVDVKKSSSQGYVGAIGPIIDTMLVCTATAFAIIISGCFGSMSYSSVGTFSPSSENSKHVIDHIHDSQYDTTGLRSYVRDEDVITFTPERIKKTNNNPNQLYTYDITDSDTVPSMIRIPFNITHDGIDIWISVDNNNTKVVEKISLSVSEDGATWENKTNKLIKNDFLIHKSGWYGQIFKFHDLRKSLGLNINTTSELTNAKISIEVMPKSQYANALIGVPKLVKTNNGISLSLKAFGSKLNVFGTYFVTIFVILLSLSTILSFTYYTRIASIYLVGNQYGFIIEAMYIFAIVLGSVMSMKTTVSLGDIASALMVFINLPTLFLYRREIKEMSKD